MEDKNIRNEQGGVGRTNFIKQHEQKEEENLDRPGTGSRDISDVDRQEGNMNHGTKGGNFDDASAKEKDGK